MPNRPKLVPTEFVNVRTGKKTYGVRFFDDYTQGYDNSLPSIPDDDLEFLRMCLDSEDEVTDEKFLDLMEFVYEEEKGLHIGDTFYDHSHNQYWIIMKEWYDRRIEGE